MDYLNLCSVRKHAEPKLYIFLSYSSKNGFIMHELYKINIMISQKMIKGRILEEEC